MIRPVLVAVVVVLAGACKTRGTIEIDFEPAANDLCVPTATAKLLYAEPNLTCEACECGACFGAKPDGVDGCPDGFCEPGAADVELDLHPGHWAVVVALLDADGRQVAGGCVEIDVDADGVSSPDVAHGTIACVAGCPSDF